MAPPSSTEHGLHFVPDFVVSFIASSLDMRVVGTLSLNSSVQKLC